MGLFDIFKRKKPKQIFEGRVFDYHEDDFSQIELVPIENIIGIKEDSKIHIRKVNTIERKIEPSEIEEIIRKTTFEKFDNVTTGYGSNQYDSEYSVAFGKQGCVLIYEFNKNLIDKLWLKYNPIWADEDVQENMAICLSEIGRRWNLILVDWNKNLHQ